MRTIRFEAIGLNQLRVLNEFVARNIDVYDLKRKDNKHMSFAVRIESKDDVCSVLDGQGLAYTSSGFSLKRALRSAVKRIGLPIGAIVALTIGVIASGRLWKIEISGNERIDDLVIIRILRDNGISVGGAMDFDGKQVEDILLGMDDVAAVSAWLVGTTLKVDVIESTVVTPEKGVGDIVSLYDAEVTRIIVHSGSAKVAIGDKVSIGTQLIEGVEYDTEGNPLLTAAADGVVYGKVNFTFSEVVSGKAVRRTGKSVSKTAIVFFGKTIGKSESVDFPYELRRTLTKIGVFLPIYAENTVYHELETYEITPEELMKRTADKAINALAIKAGSSEIEIASNYVTIAEDLYRINVHIETEISIGGRSI